MGKSKAEIEADKVYDIRDGYGDKLKHALEIRKGGFIRGYQQAVDSRWVPTFQQMDCLQQAIDLLSKQGKRKVPKVLTTLNDELHALWVGSGLK